MTAQPSPRRRRLRLALGALGYFAVAVLAWTSIDRERFVACLNSLGWSQLALVLGMALAHVAARALRYHRLLVLARPVGYRWTDGIRIFAIGLSTSAVTPARAGDLVKAALVRQYGVPVSTGLGLVAIERALDLVVIVGSMAVTSLFLAGPESQSWRWLGLSTLVLLAAGLFLLSSVALRTGALRITRSLLARVTQSEKVAKAEALIHQVFTVWDQVFASMKTLILYVLWSSVAWALEFGKLWVLLKVLGLDVGLEVAFFVYPASLLAGIVSILPFSEGLVGLTGVALLVAVGGVDTASATAAMVFDRAASVLLPLAAWAVLTALKTREPEVALEKATSTREYGEPAGDEASRPASP